MTAVLHLIDTTGPGGAETVFLDLVTGLDPSRFQPVPVVLGPGWVADALSSRGIPPIIIPTRGSFDLRFLLSLLRVVHRHQAGLIQSHLLTTSVYGSLLARLVKVPMVATFHGAPDIPAGDPMLRAKSSMINRWASRTVFVSESLRTRFQGLMAIRPETSAVVYNGVDPCVFRPGLNRSLRAELNLDEADVLIVAVGNVRPAKSYDVLLRTMVALRNAPRRYVLAIAGEASGPVGDGLRTLRTSLGLDGTVHFLGLRNDVPTVLSSADLFALSSSFEGFSIATVQAMLCSLPVVVTRSGGPEEIVTEGRDGLLVPPGDCNAMATALRGLGEAPDRAAELGARGRETAAARFTRAAMLLAYSNLYEQLLSRPKRT